MAIVKGGSRAIVTGGGSGIGFEFVKLLVSSGLRVLVADIDLSPALDAFVNANPNTAHYLKTDVTSWADLEAMFTTAHSVLGGIDLVCPNAGVFETPSSNFWYPPGSEKAKDTVQSSRYKMLDINLTHPIRVTQMAIEYFMKEGKEGHVLLVSSIAAQQPTFMKPMYCASKAAISSFTHSLAALATPPEGIPKVVVNAVAPGVVDTPLWTTEQEDMEGFRKFPFEWLQPEEIAQAMLKVVMTDEYQGGQVVEVTKGRCRLQEVLDDPGPPVPVAVVEMGEAERMKVLGASGVPVHAALRKMMQK